MIGTSAAILASALAGGGLSVLGSVLGSRKKTQTSKTTPTWDPANQGLLDQTRASVSGTLSNPSQYVEPMRLKGIDSINRRYRDVPGRVSEQLAQRGYGSSGEMGKGLFKTEMSRFGDVSDFENMINQMILGEKNSAIGQSQNLLSLTRGTESEGTIPGNAAGAGLMSAGSGLENIATLMMLTKALQGAGGGGVSMPAAFNPTGGVPGDIMDQLLSTSPRWDPSSVLR